MSLKACVEKMRESEVTEIDLCATAEYVMKSNGCDLSCATVLSSGMNTEVPTWRPTHKRIEDGEAVIIDVAPAYKGYATDVAVTVINGKATDGQKAILKASRRYRTSSRASPRAHTAMIKNATTDTSGKIPVPPTMVRARFRASWRFPASDRICTRLSPSLNATRRAATPLKLSLSSWDGQLPDKLNFDGAFQ